MFDDAENRHIYDCLRCDGTLYNATHREAVNEGWVFYSIQDAWPAEVQICGNCSAFLRTLQAIRSAKEVG